MTVMGQYLLKRLLIALPSILGISVILFTVLALAPGDPFEELATNPNVPPEVRVMLRTKFGLDDPVYLRYFHWLSAMVHGDWGFSFASRIDVGTLIMQRLPTTLMIIGTAQILALVIAIPIGVYAATRPYSIFDQIASTFAFVGFSLPPFFTGLLLILVFSIQFDWLPFVYRADLDATGWRWLWEQVRQSIVGVAPNILGSISELLLGLFIMFFVMFYGFREGQGFITYLKELLPLETGLKDSLFHQMRTVTQAVLYGQVLTAVIQGALGGLGLLVCGVPNALFWGAIMMITAFLPLLGTPLIWVPAGVGLIMDGSMTRGILLLIYGATIVMNIDNFLRPRLVSGRSNVHPVLILIGVLGGLRVFGFVGMLVGPLVMAILVALIKFYEQNYMRRKQPQSVV